MGGTGDFVFGTAFPAFRRGLPAERENFVLFNMELSGQ